MIKEGEREYPGHSHFLPYLLNRVVTKLNSDFQLELEALGLTFTQWRVLAFLHEEDGLSILALSDATDTEPSTLSRALDKMEQRGWISRVPAASDRRSIVICLHPPGRDTFHKALALAMGKLRLSIAGIPENDLRRLRQSLMRIEKNLDEARLTRSESTSKI
ncbi:MarR family winged helix-turn-helix transcriptional regulator [Bradyrhizobium sp. TM239]|uniref:MarR family winged helix-turn-helix transcriptional regulator n=1 Tax=Bradyrhizobium sp. TM239 TaxID=2599802 RepID=UPI0027D751D0|nr:MarR family transcriptional regulator [Bradyrhizobium sp. TM239]